VVDVVANLNLYDNTLNTWKSRNTAGDVVRALSRYIPDGTEAKGLKCQECGDKVGLYCEEGCLKCRSCGGTKWRVGGAGVIPLCVMGWSRVIVVGLLTTGCGFSSSAQFDEHPFIRTFDLTVLDGRILVAWTMQGGSTCDGSEVLRSTNGSDFVAVHRLEGICGDAVLDVPFSWMDDSPPELSTLSYRIKLGNEGFSSIKSVDFAQLTSSQQRFFPSPMRDEATLVLNVPASARVDLLIFDMNGRVVWEREGLVGREHRITLPGVLSGMYGYVARTEGRSFEGRFLKQ
jgi:hypothetical protein